MSKIKPQGEKMQTFRQSVQILHVFPVFSFSIRNLRGKLAHLLKNLFVPFRKNAVF